jgi:diadenosine tetraphosphate (Ap4A) HIT family hydrolase
MNDFIDFQEKFMTEKLLIAETEYWKWSLRPQQPTLGSSILSLKRPATQLSEITFKEGEEFSKIVKIIEGSLKETFNFDKINYLMLMMVDNHVHYHIIPRYSDKLNLFGVEWVDQGWPALPDLSAKSIDTTVLENIKNHIIKNLK